MTESQTKSKVLLNNLWLESEKYRQISLKTVPLKIYFYKRRSDEKRVKGFAFGGESWKDPTGQYSKEFFRGNIQKMVDAGHIPNSIALITGEVSGVTVIDRDTGKNNDDLFRKLIGDVKPYVRTQSGGEHYYFKYCPEAFSLANVPAGIDCRNDKAIAVLPPSEIDDRRYEWLQPFDRSKLTDFPDQLYGFLFGLKIRQKKERTPSNICYSIAPLSEVESKLRDIKRVHPTLGYDEWIRLCSALWSVYTYDDVIGILTRYYPEESRGEYEYKFQHRLDQVSYGTFMHMWTESMGIDNVVRRTIPTSVPVDLETKPVIKKLPLDHPDRTSVLSQFMVRKEFWDPLYYTNKNRINNVMEKLEKVGI